MSHAAGMAGSGGSALRADSGPSSYIDSVILRDRDANAGWTAASDGTLEERRYYTQNWRADVVAVTKSNGDPMEFTFYSAYGEATVHPVADVDLDGDVDSADSTCWDNGDNTGPLFAYTSTDLNFDGTGDAADDALFDDIYGKELGQSGIGKVSSKGVASRKGYAGYEHDESLTMYHVRHRVYRPDLGRWMTRDPLGYVDGMGLYEYVRGMAVKGRDPSGLAMAVPCVGLACFMPPPPPMDVLIPPVLPDCAAALAAAMADPRVVSAIAWSATACGSAAFPSIGFTECGPGDEGSFSCNHHWRDSISVCRRSNGDCPDVQQIISTLLHEIEHFIQSCVFVGQTPFIRCSVWNLQSCGSRMTHEIDAYCREPWLYSYCTNARAGNCAGAAVLCSSVCGSMPLVCHPLGGCQASCEARFGCPGAGAPAPIRTPTPGIIVLY